MIDEETRSKLAIWCAILRQSWRVIFGLIVPIILSPLLYDLNNKLNMGAYVLALMVLYWMFEPINLYITALIPVALFPLLEIATTEEISQNYMKAANMMFFAGLMMGISLEHCNLHHRISLKVIIWFGSSIPLLLAGVMIATMFLSMWINNTATTAMMIPIVDDILHELALMNKDDIEQRTTEDAEQLSNKKDGDEDKKLDTSSKRLKNLRKAFLLSIAYSANIGGTATLIGTGTNLVFQDVFYNDYKIDISFASWFFYAFPSAFLTIIAAWLLLYLLYARSSKNITDTQQASQCIRQSARMKYSDLGPMTFHEYGVLTFFIILVALWFSRKPEIITGWAELISSNPHNIKDATPAILITVLLFLIPANFHQFYASNGNASSKIQRLLCWNVVKTKMSWGVIILLGGGFALAYGTEKSGLSSWFSDQLRQVRLDPIVTMVVLAILSGFITEMASNVATANVILPVAIQMNINPLRFLIPVTICISFAFMFPVSTPPNAIVFEYLKMNISDMIKPGILMNVMAITIQLISINTLGVWIFDLKHFPEWAITPSPANQTLSINIPSIV
ncbi:Na(+)/citrate cotransporter isoform X2 [Dermatophagoides farinae]|uniref:Na(+)/citrate cotransporter isoform X2 n=1 Tax=Dermatophagoides farinae TaxID=6954 RepID=UPI001F0E2D75|nr:solute carrier family 13 member 5-like isoform X2 [Dermatophagoides farinae]